MEAGQRVKFTGCDVDQSRFRNHDPATALRVGEVYTIARVVARPFHTDVYLEGYGDARFNSVCFDTI